LSATEPAEPAVSSRASTGNPPPSLRQATDGRRKRQAGLALDRPGQIGSTLLGPADRDGEPAAGIGRPSTSRALLRSAVTVTDLDATKRILKNMASTFEVTAPCCCFRQRPAHGLALEFGRTGDNLKMAQITRIIPAAVHTPKRIPAWGWGNWPHLRLLFIRRPGARKPDGQRAPEGFEAKLRARLAQTSSRCSRAAEFFGSGHLVQGPYVSDRPKPGCGSARFAAKDAAGK